MEGSKTLFCSSNFSWVRERITSKFINNPEIRPKKRSPALGCINYSLPGLKSDIGPHSNDVTHTARVSTRLFLCYTHLYEGNSKSKFPYYIHVARFSALSWQACAQLVHVFSTRYQ